VVCWCGNALVFFFLCGPDNDNSRKESWPKQPLFRRLGCLRFGVSPQSLTPAGTPRADALPSFPSSHFDFFFTLSSGRRVVLLSFALSRQEIHTLFQSVPFFSRVQLGLGSDSPVWRA